MKRIRRLLIKKQINSMGGFGFIEVMVLMSIMSVVLVSTAMFTLSLRRQAVQIGELSPLKNFKFNLPAMINDDSSWAMIVSKNSGMSCLSGGKGSSCPVMTRGNFFALYDMNGRQVYGNSSGDGLTLQGVRCGPHASDYAYKNFSFSSSSGDSRCPLQYKFEWVALTNDPYPVVAVIVTLSIAKSSTGGPVIDLLIDTSNYDFSYPRNLAWPPTSANLPPEWAGLLFRKAI